VSAIVAKLSVCRIVAEVASVGRVTRVIAVGAGGGGGDVTSVNGQTGVVVLGASDVGAVPGSIVDAKGDLIAASAADTVVRLGVGTAGQVLTVDSGEATGMKWATPAAGGASGYSQSFLLMGG